MHPNCWYLYAFVSFYFSVINSNFKYKNFWNRNEMETLTVQKNCVGVWKNFFFVFWCIYSRPMKAVPYITRSLEYMCVLKGAPVMQWLDIKLKGFRSQIWHVFFYTLISLSKDPINLNTINCHHSPCQMIKLSNQAHLLTDLNSLLFMWT